MNSNSNNEDLNIDVHEKTKNELIANVAVEKNDKEIADEMLSYFKLNWGSASDRLKTKVENGWVTVEGYLQWDFLRETIEKSLKNIIGVKGVSNHIIIKLESQGHI